MTSCGPRSPRAIPRPRAFGRQLCEALAFFESHKEWQAFQPEGTLAVFSDFRGENAYLSGEVLNLLNRRQVQLQIVERSRPCPRRTRS